MKREEIKAKLTVILQENTGLSVEHFEGDTSFLLDLGLDSIDFMYVIFECENMFNIIMNDDDIGKIKTIGELLDQIEKLLDKK